MHHREAEVERSDGGFEIMGETWSGKGKKGQFGNGGSDAGCWLSREQDEAVSCSNHKSWCKDGASSAMESLWQTPVLKAQQPLGEK